MQTWLQTLLISEADDQSKKNKPDSPRADGVDGKINSQVEGNALRGVYPVNNTLIVQSIFNTTISSLINNFVMNQRFEIQQEPCLQVAVHTRGEEG